jgi:hypothetical protein
MYLTMGVYRKLGGEFLILWLCCCNVIESGSLKDYQCTVLITVDT